MRKLAFISLFLPLISFAGAQPISVMLDYQELCLKEHDPVKRQNYCHLMQTNQNKQLNVFQKETALV